MRYTIVWLLSLLPSAAVCLHWKRQHAYTVSVMSLPNVPLTDEHTCMMDGLRQSLLEYQGLQAPLQEILGAQGKHVIELVLGLIQQTILVHTTHQSLALEDTLGILLLKRQQGTCCITNL